MELEGLDQHFFTCTLLMMRDLCMDLDSIDIGMKRQVKKNGRLHQTYSMDR